MKQCMNGAISISHKQVGTGSRDLISLNMIRKAISFNGIRTHPLYCPKPNCNCHYMKQCLVRDYECYECCSQYLCTKAAKDLYTRCNWCYMTKVCVNKTEGRREGRGWREGGREGSICHSQSRPIIKLFTDSWLWMEILSLIHTDTNTRTHVLSIHCFSLSLSLCLSYYSISVSHLFISLSLSLSYFLSLKFFSPSVSLYHLYPTLFSLFLFSHT